MGISPLKTFGNKFNRVPNSTIYQGGEKYRNENQSYNMTGIGFDKN